VSKRSADGTRHAARVRVMLQGIPSRIVERLWLREPIVKSQHKPLIDAMAYASVDHRHAIDLSSSDERLDEQAGAINVVLGRFDALVGRGLAQILSDDGAFRIIDVDLGDAALERTVVRRAAHVVSMRRAYSRHPFLSI
jgi:hypothetical protein